MIVGFSTNADCFFGSSYLRQSSVGKLFEIQFVLFTQVAALPLTLKYSSSGDGRHAHSVPDEYYDVSRLVDVVVRR